MKNLETSIEELQERSMKQADENIKLDDRVKQLTVAITAQEAQCEQFKQMVSCYSVLVIFPCFVDCFPSGGRHHGQG